MMRLTAIERNDRRTALAIEGAIAKEHSKLLEAECTARLEEGRTVELDLTSVTYLDSEGAETLRTLTERGVTLVGCSPFVLAFVDGDRDG